MKRRTALVWLAGAGVSGCLQGRDPGTPTAVTPTPTATASPTPTPPVETEFDVHDRACGAGTDTATVRSTRKGVEVDGVISGRNTCDTAEPAGVQFDEGTLTVRVRTVDGDDDFACAQCITDIAYTARVHTGKRDVETVVVTHNGNQVTRASL